MLQVVIRNKWGEKLYEEKEEIALVTFVWLDSMLKEITLTTGIEGNAVLPVCTCSACCLSDLCKLCS